MLKVNTLAVESKLKTESVDWLECTEHVRPALEFLWDAFMPFVATYGLRNLYEFLPSKWCVVLGFLCVSKALGDSNRTAIMHDK